MKDCFGRRPGLRSCLRSYLILSSTLALAGCAGQVLNPSLNPGVPQALTPSASQAVPGVSGGYGKTSGNILVLLPLTGPLAPVGQALQNAAKLAAPDGVAQPLDIRDTGGNPAGAAAAAQAGIAAGDGVIVGPLTSAETQAVVPLAKAAGVKVTEKGPTAGAFPSFSIVATYLSLAGLSGIGAMAIELTSRSGRNSGW